MRFTIRLLVVSSFSSMLFASNAFSQAFQYPFTPKQPIADTIFNKVIVDEYRWLEGLNNPQVISWLKTQADFTNNILDKIKDFSLTNPDTCA